MRVCNISCTGSARSVREVILSWDQNSFALRRAAIAALLAATATAAAANVLVVRSSGPSAKSYPAGRSLPDNARINLAQGDMVIVLTGGGTRTFRGPGTFSPNCRRARGPARRHRRRRAPRPGRGGAQCGRAAARRHDLGCRRDPERHLLRGRLAPRHALAARCEPAGRALDHRAGRRQPHRAMGGGPADPCLACAERS